VIQATCALYPCEPFVAHDEHGADRTRDQLTRQVAHWTHAAAGLADWTRFAAPEGWHRLERYLGVAVRQMVAAAVTRLQRRQAVLRARLDAAEAPEDWTAVHDELLSFRDAYLRTETILDFYGDAINTRTSDYLGRYLRACDSLAGRSMAAVLTPLGKTAPPVLSYLDRGLGASILKAGLPLWDGRSVSAVAAIKIVRHNLHRPTSLLHEAGHQVAQILDWNQELAAALQDGLGQVPRALSALWSSWASEIAADALAFVHTGYASLVTLHDVLDGSPQLVFRLVPSDPHPVGYLRVLLGWAMCVRTWGAGPWDDTADLWTRRYSLDLAGDTMAGLLTRSRAILPQIAAIILERPYRAFGGRSLTALVDPSPVSPAALESLARSAGNALFTSEYWIRKECLRLLALCGLRVAVDPAHGPEHLARQEAWMLQLGALAAAS
jgi:hypothetical protein